MRLLNRHTLAFKEFHDKNDRPPYAIASHRWNDEEPTIEDVLHSATELTSLLNSPGFMTKHTPRNSQSLFDSDLICKALEAKFEHSRFLKIMILCLTVASIAPTIDWIWMDTCCIDTRNSTELTGALNSMFQWYREADICLAYLHDVDMRDTQVGFRQFRESDWFTRGWTLQELLAPDTVIFLDQYGVFGRKVGKKRSVSSAPNCHTSVQMLGPDLNGEISSITGINKSILYDYSFADKVTVEEKRSWMSGRKTTRIEDVVYCQLGIFGVFMPMIYGEGEHAHVRLEEEIEKKRLRESTLVRRSSNIIGGTEDLWQSKLGTTISKPSAVLNAIKNLTQGNNDESRRKAMDKNTWPWPPVYPWIKTNLPTTSWWNFSIVSPKPSNLESVSAIIANQILSYFTGVRFSKMSDVFYRQLGVFGTLMPITYGEGIDATESHDDAIETEEFQRCRPRIRDRCSFDTTTCLEGVTGLARTRPRKSRKVSRISQLPASPRTSTSTDLAVRGLSSSDISLDMDGSYLSAPPSREILSYPRRMPPSSTAYNNPAPYPSHLDNHTYGNDQIYGASEHGYQLPPLSPDYELNLLSPYTSMPTYLSPHFLSTSETTSQDSSAMSASASDTFDKTYDQPSSFIAPDLSSIDGVDGSLVHKPSQKAVDRHATYKSYRACSAEMKAAQRRSKHLERTRCFESLYDRDQQCRFKYLYAAVK